MPESCLTVAHRGASFDAPENTLAAFHLAWEQGADAIETDIHLTRDSRIVCMHDPTTRRTCGVTLSVSQSTCSELLACDAGSWKHPRYAGEKIPLLEDVIATIPARKKVYIEVKCGLEIIIPLRAVLSASHLSPDQAIIISAHPAVIHAVKTELPEHQAYLIANFKLPGRTYGASAADSVISILRNCQADGLDCYATRRITTPFVERLHKAGLSLHVWTVDETDAARYFLERGVDSITTNQPALIRKWLMDNGRWSCRGSGFGVQ